MEEGFAVDEVVAPAPAARDGWCGALAAELVATQSGVAFVYSALAQLAEHLSLDDAVLVVDEPPVGRQLFRLHRKPIDVASARRLRILAAPAVMTSPVTLDTDLTTTVASLCSLALRVDLLRHDASHDPLTGLYNRRSFDRLLEQAASRSKRYGWPFTLVLLDLNHFKAINDRHGHATGDLVLRLIGTELRQSLRAGDVGARVGGDEFALILSDGNTDITAILGRLRAAIDGGDLDTRPTVDFSAGLALAPGDGDDAVALYRLADRRLYDDKNR